MIADSGKATYKYEWNGDWKSGTVSIPVVELKDVDPKTGLEKTLTNNTSVSVARTVAEELHALGKVVEMNGQRVSVNQPQQQKGTKVSGGDLTVKIDARTSWDISLVVYEAGARIIPVTE